MLKELLDDHQTGMSQFQDDYLVTGRAGGTLYGCYKQSLREVYKRLRGLREAFCDREKLQIEIEQEKHLSENHENEFKARLSGVEYKRKSMQMEECERIITDTKREFLRFYQQACYFKNEIGELDDEKRAKLDSEMWEFKVKEMASIDLVTGGRLGRSTYEFINSLPKDMRNKLLPIIKKHSELLEWYEGKEEFLIPEDFPKVEFNFEKIRELNNNFINELGE